MDFVGAGSNQAGVWAELAPSDERGVFVAEVGDRYAVGGIIRIIAIKGEQERLQAEDVEALQQFVQPDPETPGKFVLNNCIASLDINDHASMTVRESFSEYSPTQTRIEGGADLTA